MKYKSCVTWWEGCWCESLLSQMCAVKVNGVSAIYSSVQSPVDSLRSVRSDVIPSAWSELQEKSLLSFWAWSPSIRHGEDLWAFRFFFFERRWMGEGRRGQGAPCAVRAFSLSLTRIFSALKAGWPLAASKWKGVEWFFHFMSYIIQMANKCNTPMGKDLSWTYGKWIAWFQLRAALWRVCHRCQLLLVSVCPHSVGDPVVERDNIKQRFFAGGCELPASLRIRYFTLCKILQFLCGSFWT